MTISRWTCVLRPGHNGPCRPGASNLRVRWVFRRDEIQRFFRIARVLWERGEPGKPGGGYSAKFSVALDGGLFRLPERDAVNDWRFTAFGIRLHYCRSYGGIFA